ncbi:MAG: hypothetical protein BAA01_12040 [Bacillus thermozeamaize]|uniref:Uncharacterized protein n=1 Tax=Bacillus thermozeamaize TaxID=230954 RepID=A0A1Y3PKJ5_9BACI|nr:MAG: hypothetical protein BAA01_12040 [Bacillus thermozeamaize]
MFIHRYTRQQAIADGVLIDVSEMAREAGFRYPVAITRGVYGLITPSPGEELMGQSEDGRLWDVLFILYLAIKTSSQSTNEIRFKVLISGEEISLKALCHPDDQLEPVITIMLPDED